MAPAGSHNHLGNLPASGTSKPHTSPPVCCMCKTLTLTVPEPTGFFNLRFQQSPTVRGRMGPAQAPREEVTLNQDVGITR